MSKNFVFSFIKYPPDIVKMKKKYIYMVTFCSHNSYKLCWTLTDLYLLYISVGPEYNCTSAGVLMMHFFLPQYKRGANDNKNVLVSKI